MADWNTREGRAQRANDQRQMWDRPTTPKDRQEMIARIRDDLTLRHTAGVLTFNRYDCGHTHEDNPLCFDAWIPDGRSFSEILVKRVRGICGWCERDLEQIEAAARVPHAVFVADLGTEWQAQCRTCSWKGATSISPTTAESDVRTHRIA